MASIKDIAREAKVSIGTVSLILNGRAEEMRIKPETQKKVLETARMLCYRPNLAARKLKEDNPLRAPVVGLFWPSNTTGLILERLLNGIQQFRESSKVDFELMIQAYKTDNLEALKKIIESTSMFNALLITGASFQDVEFLHSADIKQPTMLLGRQSDKYNACLLNDYEAGYDVAKLFHSRGHKSVGVVDQEIRFYKANERRIGFADGCRDFGIEMKEENIITGKYSLEGGTKAAQEIIKKKNVPTAIFFISELLAVGALKVFHENGVHIPEDIEIVSYGDTAIASHTIPSLTAVRSPLELMTRQGIGIILDIVSKRQESPVKQTFEHSFVFRQSCGGFITPENQSDND